MYLIFKIEIIYFIISGQVPGKVYTRNGLKEVKYEKY
jgi:hypothetical protein